MKLQKPNARILLLDIETSPNVGYTWGKWDQNVIEFVQNWHLLSVGYKWLGESKVIVRGLDDYPGYKKNSTDDSHLVRLMWDLFNQADIIVAHNGRAFDLKKATARFIALGFDPPRPYKTVDTLKVARKYFKFDSNKLDDLGQYLNLGRKLPHTGFHLWKACMGGDPKAWKLMKRYNAQDIVLLEKVYLRFRAWAEDHPDVSLYTRNEKLVCPTCASSHVESRGYKMLKKRIKHQYKCLDCTKWFAGSYIERGDT